jgi:sortase A
MPREVGETSLRLARLLSWILFSVAAGLLIWFFMQPELEDLELAGEQSRLVAEAVKALPAEALVTSQSALGKLVPVAQVNKDGDVFAVLKIARFGDDWQRFVGEGTRWETSLNTVGVGRYSNTSWPGEVGNFAVAGHRGGFGGSFRKINELVPGDIAEVRTSDSIFTYRFIESAIVEPQEVGVIEKVPAILSSAQAGGKYLTLTTCDPICENTHRFIAWFELVSREPLKP